jgi:hypothetical protein
MSDEHKGAETTVGCKSEEGILVGLIDSILTVATIVSARLQELDSEKISKSVLEALADLFQDSDLRFVISFGGNRQYGDSSFVESIFPERDQTIAELQKALAAMVALDHDGSDCVGVHPDCKVCAAMKSARAVLAEVQSENQTDAELPVRQMEAYAFCGDPEDGEVSKIMKGAANLIDPLVNKLHEEMDILKAENQKLRELVRELVINASVPYSTWVSYKNLQQSCTLADEFLEGKING